MITWESIIAQSLHLVQWHTHTGRGLEGQMLTAASVGPGVFPAGAYVFAPSSTLTLNGSPLYLDSAAPGVSPYLQLLVNGVSQAYMGAVGTAHHLITGSLPGDFAYRTQGGRHLWSVDSGNSASMKLYASGSFIVLDVLPITTNAKVLISGSGDGAAGYAGFYNAAGSRVGYIGYYSDNHFHLTPDIGKVQVEGNFKATGGVDVGGISGGATDSARWWGGKYVINPGASVTPVNIYYGLLMICENATYGGWALYGLLGNAAFAAFVGGNGSGGLVFSNVIGTASRINVGFSGGALTIQNTMAAQVTVYVMLMAPGA